MLHIDYDFAKKLREIKVPRLFAKKITQLFLLFFLGTQKIQGGTKSHH